MNYFYLVLVGLLYSLPVVAFGFVGYRAYQLATRGRALAFKGMPQLTQVTSRNLPKDLTNKLNLISQKAEKLLDYQGKNPINDQQVADENQFLVKKILDVHLPEAIADYQRLDNARADQMAVGTTGKTAHDLLSDYLDTVNSQFDDMLDAMYEQNAQKLLVTNRYLQARFNNSANELGQLAPPPVAVPAQIPAAIDNNTSAERVELTPPVGVPASQTKNRA